MTIAQLEQRVKDCEPNGLLKLNIRHGSGGEGIWACFLTKEDKAKYDTDRAGETIKVVTVNTALVGRPNWGAVIEVTTRVGTRPEISAENYCRQIVEATEAGTYPPDGAFGKND